MASVMDSISNWGQGLAYWEQHALMKAMEGMKLEDQDYQLLLQYLLEDAGLADKVAVRPKLGFAEIVGTEGSLASAVSLKAVTNLQGVNALVPGQRLEFGPALTAIYGANGSGKSGYARVLGSAGFTRGDRLVLPDVTKPAGSDPDPCAQIEVTVGDQERILHYEVGQGCPELAGHYVFDSTAVRVHMSESNAISFSPAGLSALPAMAEITDDVRALLGKEIEKRNRPHEFDKLFQGDSEIKRLIAGLGPKTDVAALKAKATLSDNDTEKLARLDRQIAEIKSRDVTKQIEAAKQAIKDVDDLRSQLQIVAAGFADDKMDALARVIDDYKRWYVASKELGIDQFQSDQFQAVGTDPWYRFIQAARTLAQAESKTERPYPQTDDQCLLCHQPLGSEALNLIQRLWEFLDSEAQRHLKDAMNELTHMRQTLKNIDLDFFNSRAVWYRLLKNRNKQLPADIKHFLDACRSRQSHAVAATSPTQLTLDSELPLAAIEGVQQVLKELDAELATLEASDPAEEIARLAKELRELQHREILAEHLDTIVSYVDDRKWAEIASKVGSSTRHITQKHNELFGELVTERYVELFEETLVALGRPLQVRVVTKGKKGEVYKQVVVKADSSITSSMASPDKVLSEGEKRAVALADFLTEVALDTGGNGVILDDPVTSLDLEWRHVIAAMLVRQARHKQVIIFTHDLPFLYFVKEQANQEKIKIRNHWIKRGEFDDRPGYAFLDNSPTLEKDYKGSSLAQKCYGQAKNAPPGEQERLLREGFGALRTSYEALIIFDLFNEVVLRFDERISFGRLGGIVWDSDIAEEIVKRCEKLSRHIEGHLHSDAFVPVKPSLTDLKEEIDCFDGLRSKLKKLRSQKS